MDFCFTKRELSWLDDLMPESKKKKLDDAKKKAKEEEVIVLTPAFGIASNLRTKERPIEKIKMSVIYLGFSLVSRKIIPKMLSV